MPVVLTTVKEVLEPGASHAVSKHKTKINKPQTPYRNNPILKYRTNNDSINTPKLFKKDSIHNIVRHA
tara:strand:- start:380 stop:583 length:204 start_codon:yes stop_codon:yes gene_type:complete